MNDERRVNLVLVGLQDESGDSRREFVTQMASAFGLDGDRVEKILGQLPFVLSRNCSLEEARVMAEKVQSAGGTCRLQDPEEQAAEAPESSSPPKPAAPASDDFEFDLPPAPATEGPASPPETKAEPKPQPKISVGTIPLARPATAGGGGPVADGQVKCIECGEVQPPGATCRNCYFPLPEK